MTSNLKTLLGACAVIALLAVPAHASGTSAASGANAQANIHIDTRAPTTQTIRSAPPVGAPGLSAAGIETCLGSVSGGGSGLGFGFAFGTSTKDDDCNRRLYARQLHAMGLSRAAVYLHCLNAEVAWAMAQSGIACPTREQGFTVGVAAPATAPESPATFFTKGAAAPVAAAPQPVRTARQMGLTPADLRRAGCSIAGSGADRHWACPPGVL